MSAALNIVDNAPLAGRVKFCLMSYFAAYQASLKQYLEDNDDLEECAGSLVGQAFTQIVNGFECYSEAINKAAPYLTKEEFERMVQVFLKDGTHEFGLASKDVVPSDTKLYSELFRKDEFLRYTSLSGVALADSIAYNGDILFVAVEDHLRRPGYRFSFVQPEVLIQRIIDSERKENDQS